VNATNLTILVVALIAALSSYITPKMLNRQATKQAEEDAQDATFVKLNNALDRQLETAERRLREAEKSNAEERIADAKQHKEELKLLADELKASERTVSKLYAEIHTLRQRIPPGA